MHQRTHIHRSRAIISVIAGVACLAALVRGQAGVTFTATARVTDGAGASAPVTITIDHFSTEANRTALLTALKSGGTTAVRDLLLKFDRVGSIQAGTVTTPIKYAFARPTGGGRLITAMTDAPIIYIGANAPNAPPKAGFDLALVLLDMPASGSGSGELVPAAKLRLGDGDAIVTDDYSDVVVRLADVTAR